MLENTKTNQNVLEDPLTDNEVLPEFAKKLKIHHWSPTQASLIDAAWIFRYLVLTQEQRRLLPSNSQMKAGVAAGEAIQNFYADKIYRIGPNKKLQPQDNFKKGRDKKDLITEAVNMFSEYQAEDVKDQDKKFKYLEELPAVINNSFLCIEEILGSVSSFNSIIAEQSISVTQKKSSLLMPLTGRTDLAVFSGSSSPVVICEMKTQWSKLGKIKKDGSRSFIKVTAPTLPSYNHLMQCAYYAAVYDFKAPVKLFYANANDFKIFDSSNCIHLTVEGMKKLYEQLLNIFRRREKLLSMYQEFDRNVLITSMIDSVDMNRDHPWAWNNIGDDNLKLAEELWKLR